MATATQNSASKAPLSKRRIAAYILAGLLALGALILVWNFTALSGFARLGSGYAAHVTCSCRYIEGRDMASCATDAEDGMEIVSVSDDPANKRITATVPFLAKAVAEMRGEFGCQQLEKAEIEALD
jgi:hypothetical protein